MQIFSKVEPDKILFSLLKFKDIKDKRTDISPTSEFIQTSGRILNKDFTVKAHKHNFLKRETNLTQEAWIVLKGKISAKLYDLDDTLIYETTLTSGDCITIFRGGHELNVLEDNTYFYEIKNGPYYGVEKDKVTINEK
ncbi:MAG: hypothetical protein ACJZ4H_01370 [Candidatus Pelagibacter sp.]|tara:strand:- start:545 stop:958 length:414 start_codon:yes stop_codon:yes gene_type:complete